MKIKNTFLALLLEVILLSSGCEDGYEPIPPTEYLTPIAYNGKNVNFDAWFFNGWFKGRYGVGLTSDTLSKEMGGMDIRIFDIDTVPGNQTIHLAGDSVTTTSFKTYKGFSFENYYTLNTHDTISDYIKFISIDEKKEFLKVELQISYYASTSLANPLWPDDIVIGPTIFTCKLFK